ncbi:CD209 antigen protein D [Biomphalaria glabrata]|nr:CD209 antigen protein D [Biomphalaria glabrata]
MATRIVVILVICILSFPIYQGREEEKKALTKRTISIYDAKCRKFSGFRSYTEGDVKMCLSYRQDLKNYTDARTYCSSVNSRLAVIKTWEKFQIVVPFVNAWIGLDDLETEGTFKWADGSVLDDHLKSRIFYPGEPNAYYPQENCVCQRCWTYFDKLCDTLCYLAKHYLCEKVI